MTRRLIGAASASVLLLTIPLAAPAFAQETGSMRVAVGDLQLATEPGATRALRRIAAAASLFCDQRPTERSLQRAAEAGKCKDRMTYLAVRKLDAPVVTARYERSGARPPILLARR